MSRETPSGGSQGDPTAVGNAYHYRLKDFAAYCLGQIRRVPVTFHREPADRDEEIARLKVRLSTR